ncbi:MAG: threonine/serine exporter family protein [Clostridiales bacterium]|nr:threonine/serine exporter family protein [Clostridiales bacterium]
MDYDQLLENCGKVGCRLLSAGAEIYRVEDTVKRMMAAYGVSGEVFAIPSFLMVSVTDEDGKAHTWMRRTDAMSGTDVEVIEKYNALSRAVSANPPKPEELAGQIAQTEARCRQYSTLTVLVGYLCGSLFFALFFQGGLWEGVAAGIAGIVSALPILGLEREKVNFFFKTVAAAAALGFVIYGLRALGLPIDTAVAAKGALMILVPGLVFTNFMCDLITGDAISGTSTFIRAVLTAGAIALGVGAALAVFRALDLPTEGYEAPNQYGDLAQCVFAFLACVGFCLIHNVHGGVVLCCLGGALGWGVYLVINRLSASVYTGYLAAAIFIAIYAELMARLRRFPSTSYLVVSFFPLVPGAQIYYAMYYAIQGDHQQFFSSGTEALAKAACLATGTLLVSTTARTLWLRRIEKVERKTKIYEHEELSFYD